MQTVEITRSTVAGGHRVSRGQTVDLTEAEAQSLINMGKAVPVVAAPVADNREAEQAAKTSKRAAEAEEKPKKAKG